MALIRGIDPFGVFDYVFVMTSGGPIAALAIFVVIGMLL